MLMKTNHTKSVTPLVSVLIPVYNGTQYLDEAIQSVLKSTYPNIEIILVDDGSTDKSKEKCLRYARKYKNVHSYGFVKNKGMTRCLNYGIRRAKGEFIARINQDDIMTPDRISKQVAFLQANTDHVVVGGQIDMFTNENPDFDKIRFPQTDEQIRAQWFMFSPYSDPTVMYRISAWKKTDGYNQFFWPADDVHMWYQLGMVGKLANLPDVLTRVRWHNDCGSIRSHRRQMMKTWAVHWWAAETIRSPKLHEIAFWVAELLAGYFSSPTLNWTIYRYMRKLQAAWLSQKNLFLATPSLSKA